MQKKRLLFLFLVIFAIAVYGCAQQPEMTEESLVEEPKVAEDVPVAAEEIEEAAETEEEPIIKEEPVIAEPEPVVEKKEFQIFDPVLTYDWAYNGPLYGTSEQVGSASMDSYFENLDRNGINFFIGMF